MTEAEMLQAIERVEWPTWPDGEKYLDAGPAHEIMEWLRANRPYQSSLDDARIKILFKKKLGRKGPCVVLGQAQVQNDLQRYLQPDIEFVMLLSLETWRHLSPLQKLILVDHELLHMKVTQDNNGNRKVGCVPHELEEFVDIFQQYGQDEVLGFHNLSRELLQRKDDEGSSEDDPDSPKEPAEKSE